MRELNNGSTEFKCEYGDEEAICLNCPTPDIACKGDCEWYRSEFKRIRKGKRKHKKHLTREVLGR